MLHHCPMYNIIITNRHTLVIFNEPASADSKWQFRSCDPFVRFQIENLNGRNPAAAISANDHNGKSFTRLLVSK